MGRREGGFTLVELVLTLAVVGMLVSIVAALSLGHRDAAADAAARVDLRVGAAAAEAYRGEWGTYAGMTPEALRHVYSPGVRHVRVLSASGDAYCLSSIFRGRTWYRPGPGGEVTRDPCR